MKPTIGRTVIVHGIESNGAVDHPAVITRCWSERDTSEGAVAVNLTVFPDSQMPQVHSSVMLFESRSEAQAYAGGQSGVKVAHWPERV